MKKRLLHIVLGWVFALLSAAGGPGVYAQEAFTLNPDKALSQYHIDGWTIDDGLPQGSVDVIAQTPDGYLWLGTQEGLVRFDGLAFTVFDKRTGNLLNEYVATMLPGNEGSLWIGTRGGGLTRYKDGRFETYTTMNGLTENEISSLLEDYDGTLWVGTYRNGLNRLDRTRFDVYAADQFTPLTTEQGLPSDEIIALEKTPDGSLWIGTRDIGVVRYYEGLFTTFSEADGLTDNEVMVMKKARDGGLWVGTRHGLNRLILGEEGIQRVRTYTDADGLTDETIHAFYEDAAGTIWVGTDGGGLCRLQGERFTCLSTADGLGHNTVISIYSDAEGSLWVGTDGGGLNRLKDVKFTHYTAKEGLAHDYVYSVYEAPDGAVWMGTEHGGVSRFQDGVFTTYTTQDGLAHNEVFSLGGTSDGAIWIGTKEGLNRFQDGVFTTYTTQDGLPRDDVWAFLVDPNDDLWLAMMGGVTHYQDGVFTTYTTEQGLASQEITSLALGRDGDLWVGTYAHGLDRFREGKVIEHYDVDGGNTFILNIFVDADGAVWFSMQERGLHRVKEGRMTSYTLGDGLYDDTITQILEDEQGTFWLSSSSSGIFTLPRQDLEAFAEGRLDKLSPMVYGKSDGLKTKEFMGGTQPAGWHSRDGRMWFPTVGAGVAVVNPENLRENVHPPSVIIEQATANGALIPLGEIAQVPPGRNRFVFNYIGLSLLAPEQVRYRYMLEGVDDDWIEAGARREAFYTNLKPGLTYTFKVIARNSDGVWSDEAETVTFYLKPFFHQTSLFYVLVVVGLFLLALLFYRLRIRSLKRREHELIDLVEARTSALREEKERTEEALSETEKAWREAERQKEIVQDAKGVIEEQAEKLKEMDQIKTRFFNNISHEFRTPLTLNIGPLENALLGVYGPVNDDMRRQLEVMLRNSRLLLRLINQLLDVAKLESGKMRLQVRHGNLVELLEGVVLSFTAFAEKKEIGLHFKADNKDLSLNFDPGHLEKVFFNLLSNAIKFTPENGQISVSISEGEEGALGKDGKTVIIRFKDNGAGIPAEALPHIFDRFHQVDGTISRVQEGTGIGLSLVKELVALHGGTIRCESELSAGTEFIVTLPKDTRRLDDEAHDIEFDEFQTYGADNTSAVEPRSVSHSPMVEMAVFDEEILDSVDEDTSLKLPEAPMILVVDDNPEIRDYVAGCLNKAYHVTMAVDGQEAYEKAQASHPDLIVSDVMMPNLDGYGLCRAVKADEKLSHVPVILLTSRASLGEKIKGLEAGADDYLTKPFSARELMVRVRNLLHLGLQKKELKALNDALQEANEGLREASQMKSQLLRIAAHDLKNPLNGIREFAKILKDEIDADAPGQEMLDLIHLSSDQMLDMVSKLLDSEALESGELTLYLEPVSVNEITKEVIRYNRPQAQRKDETFIVQLDDNDPCVVQGSSQWLRDAIDNLISNAIKYSPLGKRIWLSTKRHGSVVQFIVRDEGPGLTEDDMKKLFGKFQRLSAIPTSNESSTGLGLSIVKQIAQMHGGRIWAESTFGQGSTFFFELPASDADGKERSEGALPSDRDRIPPRHDRRPTSSSDSNFPA